MMGIILKKILLLLFFILSLPIIGGFDCQGSFGNENTEIAMNALGVEVKWFYPLTTSYANPIIADLDSDGKTEIIIGDEDGIINCINSQGAKEWIFETDGMPHAGSGTIADVDDDNELEVIISAGLFDPNIYCIENNGILKWKHPFRVSHIGCGSAVGDINFDGALEIITSAMLGNVTCLSEKGESLWNFSTNGLLSSPVLGDFNNDIYLEIIIQAPDMVYCLNHVGAILWNYSISEGSIDDNSPAIADFELDKETEMVVCSNNTAYCFNYNGTLRWTYSNGERKISSPVIADIDGDGKLEVIFVTFYHIICLDDEGNEKWSFEPSDIIVGTSHSVASSSPAVADFDGDNQMEIILLIQDNKTICLDSNGDLIWEIELENYSTLGTSTPAICDIDNDRVLEILINSRNGMFCLEVTGAKRLKCSAKNRAPWRCYLGSTFRTGHRDRDSDFLDDQTELFYGTDLNDPDTDNDKICDGMEVFAGTNPTRNEFMPIYISVGISIVAVLVAVTIIVIKRKKKHRKEEEYENEVELIE